MEFLVQEEEKAKEIHSEYNKLIDNEIHIYRKLLKIEVNADGTEESMATLDYSQRQKLAIKIRLIIARLQKEETAKIKNLPIPTARWMYLFLQNTYQDFNVSYNTFGNLFKLDENLIESLDLPSVLLCCKHWKLNVSYIMSPPDFNPLRAPLVELLEIETPYAKTDIFTKHDDDTEKFKYFDDDKYKGKYHGYMYSPNTSVENDRKKFILELDYENGEMLATLTYYATKDHPQTFHGRPVHMVRSNTIIILLTNPSGNFFELCFTYRPYNVRNLHFRRGMVLSASSVSDEPLVMNFVLFKKNIEKKNKKYLNGLLAVSNSTFYVTEEGVTKAKINDDEGVIEKLEQAFLPIITSEQKIAYQINQSSLFALLGSDKYSSIDPIELVKAIVLLNEQGIAHRRLSYENNQRIARFARKYLQGIKDLYDEYDPDEIEPKL